MASYDNPADAGMPYLQQIPGTVSPYYQPYINWGQQSGNMLMNAYSPMVTDPIGYYNSIMGTYSESPAYQYNQQQATQAQQGSAAAGGFTGTPYDQQQQAATTTGLLAQDQQQYLNNVLGIQGTGLQGEQNFFNTGFQASTGLADELGSNLAQEGQMSMQGAEYQNFLDSQRRNANMGLLGQGLGAGAGLFGSMMGSAPKAAKDAAFISLIA